MAANNTKDKTLAINNTKDKKYYQPTALKINKLAVNTKHIKLADNHTKGKYIDSL